MPRGRRFTDMMRDLDRALHVAHGAMNKLEHYVDGDRQGEDLVYQAKEALQDVDAVAADFEDEVFNSMYRER